MDKNKLILYGSIAAGGLLVYWYVNNYGPTGAVSAGHPSYWDTWFGTAAVTPVTTGTPAPGTTAGTGTGTGTQTGTGGTVAPAPTTGINTGSTAGDQLAATLLAKSGLNATSMANADNWGYYFNTLGTPMSSAQFMLAFPNITATDRGNTMTVNQYVQAVMAAMSNPSYAGLAGVGMGDIVPVQAVPQVPSMSFGGAFNQGGFNSKKGWS